MHIKDSVAIVTGAGTGLGKAIALLLASRGAGVCLLSRHRPNLEKVKKEIEKGGGRALACPADITRSGELERVVDLIHSMFGRIDILVNCAGVYAEGRLADQSYEDIDALVDVNVKGPLYLTRAVLPYMIDKNRGHIVNIVSTAGKRAKRKQTLYSTTKYALSGFSENLQKELKSTRIKVTAVYPSKINTALYKHSGIKRPMKNYLDPKDVATLIVDCLDRPQNLIVDDLTIIRN